MPKGLLFWILMLLLLVFGLWSDYVPGVNYPYRRGVYVVIVFVLLAILGWAQFGAPVHN